MDKREIKKLEPKNRDNEGNLIGNPAMLSITLRDIFALAHFINYGNMNISYEEADKFLEARRK